MTKQILLTVFIASVATTASIGVLRAQVRQCLVAPPSQHGYWSYRLIDGRKCWYEGKPMLSKSLLEWHAQRRAAPAALDAGPASELGDKPGKPLDANAWAPDDFDTFDDTFETRWRAIGTAH